MAVILSMLASVSGEITTGTLLISPVGSSSAMTISDQLQSAVAMEQDPVPRGFRNEANLPKCKELLKMT